MADDTREDGEPAPKREPAAAPAHLDLEVSGTGNLAVQASGSTVTIVR